MITRQNRASNATICTQTMFARGYNIIDELVVSRPTIQHMCGATRNTCIVDRCMLYA
jgi:hypothetical protein